MIDTQNFLTQIQYGTFYDDTYWTMLNKEGMILDTDKKMMDLLHGTQWTSIESNTWFSK